MALVGVRSVATIHQRAQVFHATSIRGSTGRFPDAAPGWLAGEPKARPPSCCYNRVQVCDLHKIFSTQPFMFSELPETVPEPL